MNRVTIYMLCLCLALSTLSASVSAGELTKMPLTQFELAALNQENTNEVDQIVAGEMSNGGKIVTGVLIAISVGLLISTLNQASSL